MKYYFFLLICFISDLSFGQITGIVKDSVSNEPIPYVNIWVENGDVGTSSNENGTFTLNTDRNGKTLIFSSIGYETKKVNREFSGEVIRLNPKITIIQEVGVKPNKKKYEIVIGSFTKSEIKSTFSNTSFGPGIFARFFGFNEVFKKTPFINKIRVSTRSFVNDSKFNIRLYSINENGEPGDPIFDRNILGTAKKGEKMTVVDLSELRIKMPEKGVFIAVEGLIIESNKYEYTTRTASKKEISFIHYQPSFGLMRTIRNEKGWQYTGGAWRKMFSINDQLKRELVNDPYYLLAVELTLTN